MPCYNTATVVRRAVESVLNQSITDLELIAIDDGSVDGTLAILESIAPNDARLRVLSNENNVGPGVTRNRGIEAARGEWLAFIDSDDWYEPRRLEILLEEVERDGASIVTDNQYLVRDGAKRPWRRLRPHIRDRVRRLKLQDLLEGDHWSRISNLGLLKPMVRRKHLLDHNIRYDEEIGPGEDFYFLLKCAKHASYVLFINIPLYNYLVREGSLSRSPSLDYVDATRVMHIRCSEQFAGQVEPSVEALMNQRGRDLIKALRYKRMVTPLKERDIGRSLKQIRSDPGALLIVGRMAVIHLGRQIPVLLVKR